MQVTKLKYVLMLLLMSTFLFPNNTFAQDDKKVNKKVVIIKKTIDKDGKEQIEKIINEGEDVDIDALIKSAENEDGNVEIEVEVTTDGDDAKQKNKTEKTVSVTVDGDQVKILDGENVEVIEIQGEDGTQEIKTEDGKHIIIKRLSADEGEDLNVDEMLEEVNIEVDEDGNQQIRIVKMGGPKPNEDDAFFGVLIDPSIDAVTLLDVVKGSPAQKAGLRKGDVIQNISGTEINSYRDLTDFLSKKKPADIMSVLITREQTSRKVSVVLERRGDVEGADKIKKEKVIIKKRIKQEKK